MGRTPKIKYPSDFAILRERMTTEGKLEWYRGLQSKYGKDPETGKWNPKRLTLAMADAGWMGREEERRLWLEHHPGGLLDLAKGVSEQDAVDSFEKAVAGLPDTAAVAADLAWISAHPAMNKLDRRKEKESLVVLTAEDVLKAPHGAAPSKTAARQLQHWVNRPGKFNDYQMGRAKKAVEDGSAGKDEPDPGIKEVWKLLQQVKVKE